MTRTARATFPRAIQKDRSESRTGLDKSMRKNGGGAHGWGKLQDEHELELEALEDEAYELEADAREREADSFDEDDGSVSSEPIGETKPVPIARRASEVTESDRETAKKFRKGALKNTQALDLSAIARTSFAVSGSPPMSVSPSNKTGGMKESPV